MGTINRSNFRIAFLMTAIAGMIKNPLPDMKELKSTKRELHFAMGGGNAEFHPKRTKRKGYMNSKSTFNKNR